MAEEEWSRLWHNPQLNLEAYQAVCIKRYFPLHMHDYYVFCYVEKGLQSFSYQKRKVKYLTPPGGLILLNPGDGHTGEPADEAGFEYRALYPAVSHLQEAAGELSGRAAAVPYFPKVRVDDRETAAAVRSLHLALTGKTSALELETLFLVVLTKVVRQYADTNRTAPVPGKERRAVKQACCYIREHATEGITLTEIAEQVNLSRYYLLRVFRDTVGMPPHAYLESVRVGKAKRLLVNGLPLNQVAQEAGYSDQSHFTNRFKQYFGVTPGEYVRELR